MAKRRIELLADSFLVAVVGMRPQEIAALTVATILEAVGETAELAKVATWVGGSAANVEKYLQPSVARGLVTIESETIAITKRFAVLRHDRAPLAPGLRRLVLERDGRRCVYCGASDRLECDHVIPVAQGGTDSLENLVTACLPCNRDKGARTPEEWGKNG